MFEQRPVQRPDREIEGVGPAFVKEAGVLWRETKFPRSHAPPSWAVGGRVHAAPRRRRRSRAIAEVKAGAIAPALQRRVTWTVVGGRPAADSPAKNRDAML